MPGFSYAGPRNYHGAMLDIGSQLIDRWDACVGQRSVDASTGLQKLAMDTLALAGFGARFDSFSYDGLAPIPQSFTSAFGELGKKERTTEFDKELAYLRGAFDELVEQHGSETPTNSTTCSTSCSDAIPAANPCSAPTTSATRS